MTWLCSGVVNLHTKTVNPKSKSLEIRPKVNNF